MMIVLFLLDKKVEVNSILDWSIIPSRQLSMSYEQLLLLLDKKQNYFDK